MHLHSSNLFRGTSVRRLPFVTFATLECIADEVAVEPDRASIVAALDPSRDGGSGARSCRMQRLSNVSSIDARGSRIPPRRAESD